MRGEYRVQNILLRCNQVEVAGCDRALRVELDHTGQDQPLRMAHFNPNRLLGGGG